MGERVRYLLRALIGLTLIVVVDAIFARVAWTDDVTCTATSWTSDLSITNSESPGCAPQQVKCLRKGTGEVHLRFRNNTSGVTTRFIKKIDCTAKCGDNQFQTSEGEQCGEPGAPNCSNGQCMNCKCTETENKCGKKLVPDPDNPGAYIVSGDDAVEGDLCTMAPASPGESIYTEGACYLPEGKTSCVKDTNMGYGTCTGSLKIDPTTGKQTNILSCSDAEIVHGSKPCPDSDCLCKQSKNDRQCDYSNVKGRDPECQTFTKTPESVCTKYCMCTEGKCGDGTLDKGEDCDPKAPDFCGSGKYCTAQCRCDNLCGNGKIENFPDKGYSEQCDPPGASPGAQCPPPKPGATMRCTNQCQCEIVTNEKDVTITISPTISKSKGSFTVNINTTQTGGGSSAGTGGGG